MKNGKEATNTVAETSDDDNSLRSSSVTKSHGKRMALGVGANFFSQQILGSQTVQSRAQQLYQDKKAAGGGLDPHVNQDLQNILSSLNVVDQVAGSPQRGNSYAPDNDIGNVRQHQQAQQLQSRPQSQNQLAGFYNQEQSESHWRQPPSQQKQEEVQKRPYTHQSQVDLLPSMSNMQLDDISESSINGEDESSENSELQSVNMPCFDAHGTDSKTIKMMVELLSSQGLNQLLSGSLRGMSSMSLSGFNALPQPSPLPLPLPNPLPLVSPLKRPKTKAGNSPSKVNTKANEELKMLQLAKREEIDKEQVKRLALVFPLIGELWEEINDRKRIQAAEQKEIRRTQHEMRLKNMELRESSAKTQSKLASLKTDNAELKAKIAELENKSEKDCQVILQQVSTSEQMADQLKKARQQIKQLQGKLAQSAKLFQTTLEVKMQYEEVFVKLVENPVTQKITQSIINSTGKSSSPKQQNKLAVSSPNTKGKAYRSVPSSPGNQNAFMRAKTTVKEAKTPLLGRLRSRGASPSKMLRNVAVTITNKGGSAMQQQPGKVSKNMMQKDGQVRPNSAIEINLPMDTKQSQLKRASEPHSAQVYSKFRNQQEPRDAAAATAPKISISDLNDSS